jgi:hypothetical protein
MKSAPSRTTKAAALPRSPFQPFASNQRSIDISSEGNAARTTVSRAADAESRGATPARVTEPGRPAGDSAIHTDADTVMTRFMIDTIFNDDLRCNDVDLADGRLVPCAAVRTIRWKSAHPRGEVMFRKSGVRIGVLLAAAVLVSQPLWGQDDGQWRDEMEVLRTQIHADRQAVVAAAMEFGDQEGAAFWPVYKEYRFEMGKIGDRTAALIEEFSRNYDTLTDAKASDLLQRMLTLKKERVDLQRSYVGKFKKVLSPLRVAKYYQVENKLDAVIDFELAAAIPLAQ